jgi:KDO2-lipid IV(A) lauroyltransferase
VRSPHGPPSPKLPSNPIPPGDTRRAAWWLRLIAALPLGALYALASLIGFVTGRLFPYREAVVRANLGIAFPEFDEQTLRGVMRRFYAGFAQVLVEIVKAASMPAEVLSRHVEIANLEVIRQELAAGTPVLIVAAHQCNWEWFLLALSHELGYPLDAAYKPLINPWAEREMFTLRSRFGSRLVPADALLPDILQRRKIVRAICMVADQEPTKSEHKHWVRFLNRDTAFFVGTEEIARVTRYPVFFAGMRRLARGRYRMEFVSLAQAGEITVPGELTERYARLVEAQIRASPPDWPWSHKRWRLKKSLYGNR